MRDCSGTALRFQLFPGNANECMCSCREETAPSRRFAAPLYDPWLLRSLVLSEPVHHPLQRWLSVDGSGPNIPNDFILQILRRLLEKGLRRRP